MKKKTFALYFMLVIAMGLNFSYSRKRSGPTYVDISSPNFSGLDKDGKPIKVPETVPDLNNDYQTERSELEIVLKNHNLSKYEIGTIFSLIDINKDGALSGQEWTNFRRIFFIPFENCDTSNNYVLEETELEKCVTDSTDFRFIKEKTRKKQLTEIMDILKMGEDKINFSGYMYMRRTALGWRECVAEAGKMNSAHFKCATEIATMGKTLSMGDVGAAFNVAKLQNGIKPQDEELAYYQFIRICWSYNLFMAFDKPLVDGSITEKEFRTGLNDGVLPSKFNSKMISSLFSAFDPAKNSKFAMNFSTFVIVQLWWDKFSKLSEGGIGLNRNKFCLLLNEPLLKTDVMDLIDYCLSYVPEEFLNKASTSPTDGSGFLNEKDYIMFLDKIQRTQRKRHKKRLLKGEDEANCKDSDGANGLKANMTNREIVFNILDTNNDNLVGFSDFILFLKFSYSFSFLDSDKDGLVHPGDINRKMATRIAPIYMTKAETKLFSEFRRFEIEARTSILQFLAYCFANRHFQYQLLPETRNLVQGVNIRNTLSKLSIRINDSDFQYASMGVPLSPHTGIDYNRALKISLQTYSRGAQLYREYLNKKKS